MNFFELDVSYFRSNESFFVGLFHGTLFSLPLSLPNCVLINRLEQFKAVKFSLFFGIIGLVFSYFLFFSLICFCSRPLVQFWMTAEPGFMLIGLFLLTQGLLTQRRLDQMNSFSKRNGLILIGFQLLLTQVLFLFFNPVFPGMISKILVSQDILEHAVGSYFFGFFCTAFCFFVVHRLLAPYILQAFLRFSLILRETIRIGGHYFQAQFAGRAEKNDMVSRVNAGSLPLTALNKTDVGFSFGGPSSLVTQVSAFCIMGLLIQGNLQSSWRIFVQYPLEFFLVPRSSLSAEKNLLSDKSDSPKFTGISPGQQSSFLLREFPSFDSCTRHREKNLPVERHLAIERMNARRTLSGRAPFNEEQKSDAALKYNSFFLNALEQIWTDFQLRSRELLEPQLTVWSGTPTEHSLLTPSIKAHETDRKIVENTFENKTKGKPKFPYIRSGITKSLTDFQNQKSSYIHDDISVLQFILRQ